MDRRAFLALAASVPLLAPPASADDDSDPAQVEQTGEDTQQSGTDSVTIDIRLT